jgi:VanZ family protein
MTQSVERHVWLSRYVPLFLWIGIIFFLSSSQGSMSETSRIIRPILEFLFPDASPETISIYHGAIRKFAHFAEYAVLALLAFRVFVASRLKNRPFVVSILLALVIAVIDETGQSFNAARTGSAVDVLIDFAGACCAIALLWLVGKRPLFRRSNVPA